MKISEMYWIRIIGNKLFATMPALNSYAVL